MVNPYKDELEGDYKIRTFSEDVSENELIWHRDRNDREITVVEGAGWQLQMDNKLPEDLQKGKGKRIAIPGEWTSAHLATQMYIGEYDYGLVEFDQIPDAVERGDYDAGVLIHEGQLTFQDQGLVLLRDLGEWWQTENDGLPLPLGGNTVRRDLGDLIPRVSQLLQDSIRYGLENRVEAVEYALQWGRDLSVEQADEFIGMYVNERTLDYGDDGRLAVKLFLEKAHKMGIIPEMPPLDFQR